MNPTLVCAKSTPFDTVPVLIPIDVWAGSRQN
jgi:hypothetical protein